MRRMRATAGPAALVHLMVPAAVGPWPWQVLPSAPVPCSSAERRPAGYRDRESARASRWVFAADRAEPPSEHLRLQNCGCSLLARPDEVLPTRHRVPASRFGTFGEPALARASSQSRASSADLSLLSGALAPVALEQDLADAWLREHGRAPPLPAHVQRDYYVALSDLDSWPSVWHDPTLHRPPRA